MHKLLLAARVRLFANRFRDDQGATAVEYAIMVSLIALVIIGAVATVGTRLNGIFSNPTLTNALT